MGYMKKISVLICVLPLLLNEASSLNRRSRRSYANDEPEENRAVRTPIDAALLDSSEAEVANQKVPERPVARCFPDDTSPPIEGYWTRPKVPTDPAPFNAKVRSGVGTYCMMKFAPGPDVHGWLDAPSYIFYPDGPSSFIPDKTPKKPLKGVYHRPADPHASSEYGPTNPNTVPKGNTFGIMREAGFPDVHGYLASGLHGQNPIFYPDGDSNFFPDDGTDPISGKLNCPQLASQSSEFFPVNPSLFTAPAMIYGSMKGVCSITIAIHGYIEITTSTTTTTIMKYIFHPDGPASFVPDSSPNNPIKGLYDRPPIPTSAAPYHPSNPAQVAKGQTQGIMREAGHPDVHGYLESTGPSGPVTFYPDGPASFYPDGGTPAVKGVYDRPPVASNAAPYHPTNPTQVGPGQTPGTMKEAGHPDVHGYLENNGPNNVVFHPDGPASFFPDGGTPPIKGVYDRPPQASDSAPYHPTNPKSVAPGHTPGTMKEAGHPDVHGFLDNSGPNNIIFHPDGPASFFPDSGTPPIKGVYDRPPVASNPSPYHPSDPAQVAKGHTPGNMKEPGHPDVHGYIDSPGPGQPVTFYPDGPSSFFPDKGTPPIKGVYDRPPVPTDPSPYHPSDPAQVPPGQTMGNMREPGHPDVHGYIESSGPNSVTFHPDLPKPKVPFDPTKCVDDGKKHGAAVATAASETGLSGANAITKGGGNAIANAINGTTAKANSIAAGCGNATSNSKTYGAGGAHSNAMVKGTGHAAANAESLGTGDANANSMANQGNAASAALAAGGGNAKANAMTSAGGNASAQSKALKGGNAASNSVAKGGGSATSGALAEGGGNATAGAQAIGGGDAKASSKADGSGNAASNSKATGGGSATSMAAATGGGNAQSNAVADGGGDATAGACAGGPCSAQDMEDMQKMFIMSKK